MKAIETKYRGFRFRSRLEARWAVFFDALGIRWDYEPEGYQLNTGEWYLPDFFVHFAARNFCGAKFPRGGYWIEIKPTAPDVLTVQKLADVCIGTSHSGYILWGSPWAYGSCTLSRRGGPAQYAPHPMQSADVEIQWGRFATAGSSSDYADGLRGVLAAKGARFEHGDRPRLS